MITKEAKVIVGIYLVTVLFWGAFVLLSGYSGTYEGNIFNYLLKPFLIGMTILPMTGGVIALINSKGWGGFHSSTGKALAGIGLGMLAWSGGMVIWNYFLFFTDIEVPYPSIADAIFILSWPFWTYGLIQIAKTIGAKYALRKATGKITLIIIPIIAIAISYYLLFQIARGGEVEVGGGMLKLFFDLFYPIGDVVILVVTAAIYNLSRNVLGGIYKEPIMLLFLGFLFNYVSDFMFSYTTTKETYFNGHLVDFLFTTTMFILSLGISLISVKILRQTNASQGAT